jgi:predicted transcriptional regulator
MEYCIISDELSKFVLGISTTDWDAYTAKDGGVNGMSPELKKEESSIAYIKSLPSGSISQTRALSKLRFLVRKHLRNVNIKGLVTKDKMKEDMKKGHMKPVAGFDDTIQRAANGATGGGTTVTN